MPNFRSDKLQLIGFLLLLVAIAAASTLIDIAAEAEGPWRMIGIAGVFGIGLWALYRLPGRVAPVAVMLASLAIGTAVMALRLDPLAFHTLSPLLVYPLATWLAAGLIVREVYPRLPPERARLAPVVGGILLVLHLATGFVMLTSARGFLTLDDVPVIRDGAALAAAVPRTDGDLQRAREWGVFTEARVGAVPGGGLAAQHECNPDRTRPRILLSGLWRWRVRGAAWIDLVLSDGTPLRVERVEHVRNTWAWPTTNPAQGECGLSEGDPVLIRAIPRDLGDGLTLRDTTLIAYGTAEDLARTYAPRAELAARQFGGVAFLLMLSGLIPLIAGLLRWRRG